MTQVWTEKQLSLVRVAKIGIINERNGEKHPARPGRQGAFSMGAPEPGPTPGYQKWLPGKPLYIMTCFTLYLQKSKRRLDDETHTLTSTAKEQQ